MKLKDFREMAERTTFCALSGIIDLPRARRVLDEKVYLEKSEGTLIMAASNNRLLGFTCRIIGDDFPDFDKVIVPASVLRKIARKRGKEEFAIFIEGKNVNFHIGCACISVEALSGEFTRFYRNPEEFPKLFPLSLTVERLAFFEALKMASFMTSIEKPEVCIDLSPEILTLYAGDDEGSFETNVPCNYLGEKAELTFNIKMLMEIIEHIDTALVHIRFEDQKPTVVFLPDPKQDYFFFLAQRKRG